MLAIYKREMRSYFTSVIGYVFLVLFLALGGVVFCYTTLYSMSANVSNFFTYMLLFSAIVLPLLTMKSFSEERKIKTEQLLLTAPVSLTGMVLGKFFASMTMFGGALLLNSLYFLFLIPYAALQTALLFGTTIREIKDKTVVIASKDGKNVFEVEYDNIVNGIGFVPAPVGGKGKNIHRVGDCVTIGNLRTAIWRAWDVCMKI